MSRFIIKQSGDAPKSLSHMAKFNDNSDLIYHLQELKKSWNESDYGEIDFDLMEVVDGLEVAASAFFNGKDWVRNSKGKVIGFINFEEKKEANNGQGETCGETGTTFLGCTEDNKLFRDILLKPQIKEILKKFNFKGVFDINCIQTKQGLVALEATSRFGVPSTSYEFLEGLKTPVSVLIEAMAKGTNTPVEIHEGWGMVIVVAAKPFPLEGDIQSSYTSIGERIWPLKNGKPAKDFDLEQQKHIHLYNAYKTDEGEYKVATTSGYILTVTGRGKSIKETRENLIAYIKDNLYLSNMKIRTDIGKRVEEFKF